MKKTLFFLALTTTAAFVVYKIKKWQTTSKTSKAETQPEKPLLLPMYHNRLVEDTETKRPNLKIMVYGYSSLSEKQIVSLIRSRINEACGIELRKSDVKVLVSNDRKNLKKLTPANLLLCNQYDYFIVGAHPHSVKGKDLSMTWTNYLQSNNVETVVFENHNRRFNKKLILSYLEEVIVDLRNKKNEKPYSNVA